MLAINIGIALIILFNTLYAKEVLDMAAYPTMLLFTTLFRISLNVSSTKLILKNGDAGPFARGNDGNGNRAVSVRRLSSPGNAKV